MENKNVGYLLLGISVIVLIIVILFNLTISNYIDSTCPLIHPDAPECPAHMNLSKQTYLSSSIVGILIIVSLFLIFSKQNERVIIKKIKQKAHQKQFDLSQLKSEEKLVFNLVKQNKAIFQADIIEKTGFGKAKVSRIIDRLEGKEFVERKRRGMTNIVVLKE